MTPTQSDKIFTDTHVRCLQRPRVPKSTPLIHNFEAMEKWMTAYEFSLARARVIKTGEIQLVLSPAAVSWPHELEYFRLEELQEEAEWAADKVRQMDNCLEAEFLDSLCKAGAI